jgi:broad specificity phosphatase PhoE
MLRIVIARHGQTSYNREFRNQGHADIELDEVGVAQATCLRSALDSDQFDAVYSSPLVRASKTADTVARGAEVIVDSRIAERDYGSWEGMTRDEILNTDAEGFAAYRADPVTQSSGGGETGLDVFMRCVSFLSDLFLKHPEGSVLIVTHGGSGSALIAALIHGSPATADCFRLSNCSLTEILVEGSKRRLVRFDDHAHLDEAPLRYPHAGIGSK